MALATAQTPKHVEATRTRNLRSDLLLLGPATLLLVIVLLIPLLLLLATSLNPSQRGVVGLSPTLTIENYVRLFTVGLYPSAIFRSVFFGATTATVCVVLGYPIAFIMTSTSSLRVVTLMTILLLIPLQLDVIVRVLGLIVILGDNGLINGILAGTGLISHPLPLMYNDFGVIVGTTSFMLPFAVFSIAGSLRSIDPELILAARSLGSPYWPAFRRIVIPLSAPGIVAAALVTFTLTVSNFVIPVLMSSYHSVVLPALMHEQVVVVANFRFAATMGVALLFISLLTIVVAGGLVRRIFESI